MECNQFHRGIAELVSSLESFFGVEVGCNVYSYVHPQKHLFPPLFIMDLNVIQSLRQSNRVWPLIGMTLTCLSCKWKGRSNGSSMNGQRTKFVMECTVNPGDLLYFPRGTVECLSLMIRLYVDWPRTLWIRSTSQRRWGVPTLCI